MDDSYRTKRKNGARRSAVRCRFALAAVRALIANKTGKGVRGPEVDMKAVWNIAQDVVRLLDLQHDGGKFYAERGRGMLTIEQSNVKRGARRSIPTESVACHEYARKMFVAIEAVKSDYNKGSATNLRKHCEARMAALTA